MLNHPTLDKLLALRLTGMAKALSEQMDLPESQVLSFEERLGLLVDREMTVRSDRRLTTRLRQAKLRLSASIEDIDYRHPRGLDKSLMLRLASCQWVHDRHNVLITGPTGMGKTWLACALGHKACREGYTVLYLRLPRLLQELPIAKGDGRYPKLMASLAKTALSVTVLSRVKRHTSIVQWAYILACWYTGALAPGQHGTASSHEDHCRGSS